ncbi:TPA: hypothetical protein H1011_01550 [archaeon]|uniref:Dockerin domain-containing protein n=1 Tax=Candidatus Undinarchaeum marinum TaxID=2756141 RepID=A0A832V0E3_9ARCH|nr:hypothetical protein [Candidatus Undinarchaeum marinum]
MRDSGNSFYELDAGIHYNSFGDNIDLVGGNLFAWTGSMSTGAGALTGAGNYCSNWGTALGTTAAGTGGSVGYTNKVTHPYWLGATPDFSAQYIFRKDCSNQYALICMKTSIYADDDGDGVDNHLDCAPIDASKHTSTLGYPNSDGDTDADGNALFSDSPGFTCTDGTLSDDYTDASGVVWRTSPGTDCDDSNATKQHRVSGYPDFDGDGYTVGADDYSAERCVALSVLDLPDTPTSQIDCDDTDAQRYRLSNLYADTDEDTYTADSAYGGTVYCVGDAPESGEYQTVLPSALTSTGLAFTESQGLDCDDDTSDDPSAVTCPTTVSDCSDSQYSTCAFCTYPGFGCEIPNTRVAETIESNPSPVEVLKGTEVTVIWMIQTDQLIDTIQFTVDIDETIAEVDTSGNALFTISLDEVGDVFAQLPTTNPYTTTINPATGIGVIDLAGVTGYKTKGIVITGGIPVEQEEDLSADNGQKVQITFNIKDDVVRSDGESADAVSVTGVVLGDSTGTNIFSMRADQSREIENTVLNELPVADITTDISFDCATDNCRLISLTSATTDADSRGILELTSETWYQTQGVSGTISGQTSIHLGADFEIGNGDQPTSQTFDYRIAMLAQDDWESSQDRGAASLAFDGTELDNEGNAVDIDRVDVDYVSFQITNREPVSIIRLKNYLSTTLLTDIDDIIENDGEEILINYEMPKLWYGEYESIDLIGQHSTDDGCRVNGEGSTEGVECGLNFASITGFGIASWQWKINGVDWGSSITYTTTLIALSDEYDSDGDGTDDTAYLTRGRNTLELTVTDYFGRTHTESVVIAFGIGDMNKDGTVDGVDLQKAKRLVVGLDTIPTGLLDAYDVNRDGRFNSLDITVIDRLINSKYLSDAEYTKTSMQSDTGRECVGSTGGEDCL